MAARTRPWVFRRVRTTQERRMNVAHEDIVHIRGKRKLLPHSYDDPYLSKWWVKSWKDLYRKRKQWMKSLPRRVKHWSLEIGDECYECPAKHFQKKTISAHR